MGITFAKLFQRLFSKKEMRILMVRDVLRSRDGFGREPYGLVVFFFDFFFSFRVKIRDDGTLHFESRWKERDRVSSSPSEGWMRRVYAGRMCSIICVYISRMYRSIEWVWRRKEDVQKPNRLRGRAAKIFGSLLRHFEAFFFHERLLTKILYTFS